uniref:ER membrane protein complex subunit 8 n=1 Tax=Sphenodon punctatus TaxID=8508 RepID=A0A8D0GTN9_SPHPU
MFITECLRYSEVLECTINYLGVNLLHCSHNGLHSEVALSLRYRGYLSLRGSNRILPFGGSEYTLLVSLRCCSARCSINLAFFYSPNQVAEKVASRIAEGFNDTTLIMVDNTKFTMECLEPTIHVYEHHENKWKCKDPYHDYCEDWSEAQRIATSLLDSRSYETLVDFDNHLDDLRHDWTNPEINKAVLHLC